MQRSALVQNGESKGDSADLQFITTDCHDGHKETHAGVRDENDIGQRPTKFARALVSKAKHATVQRERLPLS
jgi:hypothetical protein